MQAFHAAAARAALRGAALPPPPQQRTRACRAGAIRAGFLDGLFGGGAKKPSPPPGKPKPGMRPVSGASCKACGNKGGVTCTGCKGSGRNKANGNPFERFKCYDCQGFGLVPCKACGRGGKGLTPEQTGER